MAHAELTTIDEETKSRHAKCQCCVEGMGCSASTASSNKPGPLKLARSTCSKRRVVVMPPLAENLPARSSAVSSCSGSSAPVRLNGDPVAQKTPPLFKTAVLCGR